VKYFFQIREVPDDFFVDIVSSNNFLVTILTQFFATIRHNSETIDPNLRLKADRFKAHLTQKFNWDFDEDELDEDLPVVVETN
jgi:A1 cistron-splicing factor AAR2